MEKLFAVLGMLANAGKDTVFKVAAGEEGGSRTNLFYTLKAAIIAGLALFILLVVKRQTLLHVTSLRWAIPIGIFTYSTYTLTLRSLVGGEASSNITIFRLNFVLSVVFAVIFLHEALTVRKVAGLVLCLAAILVFFLGNRSPDSRGGRGALLAVLACLSAAILNTLNKIALNDGVSIFHLIFYRYILVCAISGTAVAILRQSAIPTGKLLAASGASAVLMLASLFFILTALQGSGITLVIPISQLSFLFTAVFSFVFFREKLNAAKAFGLAVALISIAVIG
jgi:transporter family protein